MIRRRTLLIAGIVTAIVVVTVLVIGLIVSNINNIIAWGVTATDPTRIIECADSAGCQILHPIIFGLIFIFLVLTGFAYTTLLERKLLAALQQRVGPNRVGPGGFLQPLADAVKLIFKEDIIPDEVDKPVYYMAPVLKAVPVIVLAAVVPLAPPIVIPWFDGFWYRIPLVVADLSTGVLWVLVAAGISTYGVVLAGWSSNNKYAMLGGLRATAQMISYELALGLSIAVPVMLVGSMNMTEIVGAQRNIWDWFVFQNPLAAGLLMITLFAEVARAPFDLAEAEQELTAGFMTEYSGMKFATFMMAEYMGMIGVSLVISVMYFGGYNLIPVDSVPLLGVLFTIGKVVLLLLVFIWVRGTLPRIRYDRLMMFGWKVLLPLSLLAVAWTAISIVIGDTFQSTTAYLIASGVFFVVIVAGGYLLLRNQSETSDVAIEDDLADDPLITGERNGLGWAALTFLGTLVAIPFVLIGGLVGLLGRLGGEDDASDETAIEVVQSGD